MYANYRTLFFFLAFSFCCFSTAWSQTELRTNTPMDPPTPAKWLKANTVSGFNLNDNEMIIDGHVIEVPAEIIAPSYQPIGRERSATHITFEGNSSTAAAASFAEEIQYSSDQPAIDSNSTVNRFAIALADNIHKSDSSPSVIKATLVAAFELATENVRLEHELRLARTEAEHHKEIAAMRESLARHEGMVQRTSQPSSDPEMKRWLNALYNNQNRNHQQIRTLSNDYRMTVQVLSSLNEKMARLANNEVQPNVMQTSADLAERVPTTYWRPHREGFPKPVLHQESMTRPFGDNLRMLNEHIELAKYEQEIVRLRGQMQGLEKRIEQFQSRQMLSPVYRPEKALTPIPPAPDNSTKHEQKSYH